MVMVLEADDFSTHYITTISQTNHSPSSHVVVVGRFIELKVP